MNREKMKREEAIATAWRKHIDALPVGSDQISHREFVGGFDAGAASVDRVEVVGVDRSAVLTMIQAAKEGDWERFDSYARFGAEKTGNERFIKAVDRFLRGDYGAEVIAAMEKGK